MHIADATSREDVMLHQTMKALTLRWEATLAMSL
ncbi:hypothetical protein EKPJFOCH_4120 [Methylobacterium thuringiense]|uniref:Uncharacterized protein n=1 Tax=Methylobacterium thuringiense TaxID=1003091 RepID=A0ABQ4TSG6_9HYPH|nr:hypothetical protein EKPJFOCH_4120 [Methylobacterium thuringiense]